MGRHICWLTVLVALMSAVPLAIQVRDRDATWAAPSKDAAKVNPLATRPDAVAGGRKLFHRHCSTCHGEAARGGTKAPDLTQTNVQAQTDGALFWKISGGNSRHGMPAFSFLPAPQRWQLVLHIRAAAAK
jgi:mono/diheme cytochrome c family protein